MFLWDNEFRNKRNIGNPCDRIIYVESNTTHEKKEYSGQNALEMQKNHNIV